MSPRLPTKTEIAFQLLFVSLLGLVIFDYTSALEATACGKPDASASGHCYPWGAEGPAAGDWAYASKDNYLRASQAQIVLLIITILAPFFAASRRTGILLMIGIAAVGLWRLQWLADLL